MQENSDAKYVALLRGINLGKRNIRMDELRAVFIEPGFTSVQTVLASGNVIFASTKIPNSEKLQTALKQKFGFEIGVVLRSIAQLQTLMERQPFAKYEADKNTRFYAVFSSKSIGMPLPPHAALQEISTWLKLLKRNFLVAFRQKNGRSGAGMDGIEKLFKQQLITTRNWNTVEKILDKANS